MICGLGAAGVAVAKILLEAGARHIIGCDSRGRAVTSSARTTSDGIDARGQAVRWRRPRTPSAARAARPTCSRAPTCSSACRRARVMPASALARMNPDPIVFAMANPDPEVSPEEAAAVRADPRHRPLRLPEPDQQRARASPASSAARSTSARTADHRGDEDRRGARDRRDRRRPTSCARTTSSRRCSTARWSGGRRGGRRRGAGERHRRGRRRARVRVDRGVQGLARAVVGSVAGSVVGRWSGRWSGGGRAVVGRWSGRWSGGGGVGGRAVAGSVVGRWRWRRGRSPRRALPTARSRPRAHVQRRKAPHPAAAAAT